MSFEGGRSSLKITRRANSTESSGALPRAAHNTPSRMAIKKRDSAFACSSMLVAIGASDADETGTLVRGGMTDGVLSMDSFLFGAPNA